MAFLMIASTDPLIPTSLAVQIEPGLLWNQAPGEHHLATIEGGRQLSSGLAPEEWQRRPCATVWAGLPTCKGDSDSQPRLVTPGA